MNGSNIILHNMAIQSYIIKLFRWFFFGCVDKQIQAIVREKGRAFKS